MKLAVVVKNDRVIHNYKIRTIIIFYGFFNPGSRYNSFGPYNDIYIEQDLLQEDFVILSNKQRYKHAIVLGVIP